jgi:hypothetical protein
MEKNTWYSYPGILSPYNPLSFKYIIPYLDGYGSLSGVRRSVLVVPFLWLLSLGMQRK